MQIKEEKYKRPDAGLSLIKIQHYYYLKKFLRKIQNILFYNNFSESGDFDIYASHGHTLFTV